MDVKQYKLRFLSLFEDDLNEIVDYITIRLPTFYLCSKYPLFQIFPTFATMKTAATESFPQRLFCLLGVFLLCSSGRNRSHRGETVQLRPFP